MCAYVFLSLLDVLCELCVCVCSCVRELAGTRIFAFGALDVCKNFSQTKLMRHEITFFFHGGVWGEQRESSGSAGH